MNFKVKLGIFLVAAILSAVAILMPSKAETFTAESGELTYQSESFSVSD